MDRQHKGDEMTTDYTQFLASKAQLANPNGFEPYDLPDYLFPFQAFLTEWAIRKGRAALFADCGMGKTLMEMVWAKNVYQHTGKPVLILTPLAVANQFVTEANTFGIELARSHRGEIGAPIMVTNYERIHLFNQSDFGGVVCDESSILKSFDGTRKAQVTEFMRQHKYRLLGTATAAPNDYTELGTSSEALGHLGYMDMLGRFFTNKQKTSHSFGGRWRSSESEKFRFKGHAEQAFWQWVASWARALRKPSDMGFDDNGFILPPLSYVEHVVKARTAPPGMLFALPAVGLQEERSEVKRTIQERCETAAALVADTSKTAVVWCHRNDEGDLLEKMIPGSKQVSGKDSDEQKEEKFEAFTEGDLRVLVTKPKIGAWGLNWQHCNHAVYFPSHSYEQLYQATRRFWRFGQHAPVTVDIVATEGQIRVLQSLQRKSEQASEMFTRLVEYMNDAVEIDRQQQYTKKVEVPGWLF